MPRRNLERAVVVGIPPPLVVVVGGRRPMPATGRNDTLRPTPPLAERLFTWIMTRHRSLVVVVFALPLSLLWDMLLWLRQLIVFWMQSAPYQHPERVRRVAAQVKARPKGMRMCTGRPGWQSMSLSYRDCKFAITPPARFVGMSQLLPGGRAHGACNMPALRCCRAHLGGSPPSYARPPVAPAQTRARAIA